MWQKKSYRKISFFLSGILISTALALRSTVPLSSNVRALVNTTSCGGISEFERLGVLDCEDGADCQLFAESLAQFYMFFRPSHNITELTLLAIATSESTGLSQTIAFRHEMKEYPFNDSGSWTTFLNLPAISTQFDTYKIQFRIETETGLEVCEEANFPILSWNETLTGNFLFDSCNAAGLNCNFPNSFCNASNICTCDWESAPNGNVCLKAPSWACSTASDCTENAGCYPVLGGNACRCRVGAYQYGNRCVVNEATRLWENCTYRSVPCSFPRSYCSISYDCECNEFSTPAPDNVTCVARPNTPCENSADCVPFSSCQVVEGESICVCDPGYVAAARECRLAQELELFEQEAF